MRKQPLAVSDVPGIGAVTASELAAHGIDSAQALAAMPLDALAGVPGFGAARAARVIGAAARLLAGDAVTPAKPPATATRARRDGARSPKKTAAAVTGEETNRKPGKKAEKARRKAEKAAKKLRKAEKKAAEKAKKKSKKDKKAKKKGKQKKDR